MLASIEMNDIDGLIWVRIVMLDMKCVGLCWMLELGIFKNMMVSLELLLWFWLVELRCFE